MKKSTSLYSLFLTIVMAVFAVLIWRGNWLETDLKALLPQEEKWSALQIKADDIQEQSLNKQFVFLLGASEQSNSFQLAEQLAQQLEKSGLFSQIFAKNTPNLTALQREIQQLKWAILPQNVRSQLAENPQQYFQQLAESLANPFAKRSLLSIEQDWLGFGRFALDSSQALSKMQWNPETGAIFTESDGKVWTLLRTELANSQLMNPQADLLNVVAQAKQFAHENQAELLVAGSALFGAIAKQSAEQESALMSTLGISLTLILLLTVFRTFRALWLLLPIGLGLMAGIVATVLVFGQIHILTLVVGTSLIGVLVDFPLHWLTGAKFSANWHPKAAMTALKPTFLISLLVTLLGYGLLAFTTLPILKQTALFSAAALVVAVAATILYLPNLVHRIKTYQVAEKNGTVFRSAYVSALLGVTVLAALIGISRSQWQDDIRQWVALPEAQLNEASYISRLTGIDLGTQYFLITAETDEQLLVLNQQLSAKLTEQGLAHQALSQWILPQTQQRQFALQISEQIRPLDYAVINELGIPSSAIANALVELKMQPTVSLEQALKSELGQGWKTLYLGELAEGVVGSILKVNNAKVSDDLAAFADNQHIFWQDKRSHLNQAFQAARDQAAWLKVASFGLAFLLLWRGFGAMNALKMLAIPFLAILMTVGVFGWLGLPITLFAMFGLLLVSAIGIDYTAYMVTAKEPRRVKQFAVSLAALTTMISFILLAFSSTPAVVSFGLSVALGVLFSLLLTLYFSENMEKKDANSV